MDIETTLAGKLKLATLLLGGLAVALAGSSLCKHELNSGNCLGFGRSKEEYFMAISCIALILSFLLVIVTLFNVPRRFKNWWIFDLGYHLLMAVLLIIGWVVFCISVNDLHKFITKHYPAEKKKKYYTGFMTKRSFALIFQLINFVAYVLIAFFIFKRK